jgi:hypothetical protein
VNDSKNNTPGSRAIIWRLHLATPPGEVYPFLATGDGRARFSAESARAANGVISLLIFKFPPKKLSGCVGRENNFIRQSNSGRRADNLANSAIITGGWINKRRLFTNQRQRLGWAGGDTSVAAVAAR